MVRMRFNDGEETQEVEQVSLIEAQREQLRQALDLQLDFQEARGLLVLLVRLLGDSFDDGLLWNEHCNETLKEARHFLDRTE